MICGIPQIIRDELDPILSDCGQAGGFRLQGCRRKEQQGFCALERNPHPFV